MLEHSPLGASGAERWANCSGSVTLIKLLAALGVVSLLNLVYYLWLERDLEFVYGVIYSYYAFFLLQWIYPYACLTVRNRDWLTR